MIARARHLLFHATTFCCLVSLSLVSICCGISHSQQQTNAVKPTAPTARKATPRAQLTPDIKPATQQSPKTKITEVASGGTKGNAVPSKPTLDKHIVTVFGSFAKLGATPKSLKAQVVAGDISISDDAVATLVDASQVKVTYSALSSAPQPTVVYLGVDSPDTAFPFVIAKTQDVSPLRRLVVSGDFCRALPDSTCGSNLLTGPGESSSTVTGYVYGADGTGYTPVTVHRLT